MEQNDSMADSPRRRHNLLRDKVQLKKRKDTNRYEIVPFPDPLSFEKGFFVMIRACQLLVQHNEGITFVGVAGPSGAGKTVFTEKVLNFMPDVAVISMDNYNDATRIVDGNFDDPRLTDYDTLLENIHGLKEGRSVQVPIYDFKLSCRTGYRTVDAPSSRIVIIEGIYALSEKLRPMLDLRVSVTGGVHFDLVKRVLRDIQRAGQEPEEIIHQISETVYPMYKAFIEPDLETAHIKIRNKFNPFTGFQNPMYILKSPRSLTPDKIKAVLGDDHTESNEETYDIYLLPPGEDPEACQSYLRMRNREGKYNLMFEEWVTDNPFIISPRITFEVSVRLLGGLMALGYTIAAILKRSSRVFSDGKATVKIDWLEQLNRQYTQVQGRDRLYVKFVAEQLGLDGSYIPRTYIEQIQLEKLMNDVMALPEDLKTKLSIDDELVSSPKEAFSRVSADKRNKLLKSGLSYSYSTHGDKNIVKLSNLTETNRRFGGGRAPEAPAINQGAITQLSAPSLPSVASASAEQQEAAEAKPVSRRLPINSASQFSVPTSQLREACRAVYTHLSAQMSDGNEFAELLWENGQAVVHGRRKQPQTAFPPFTCGGASSSRAQEKHPGSDLVAFFKTGGVFGVGGAPSVHDFCSGLDASRSNGDLDDTVPWINYPIIDDDDSAAPALADSYSPDFFSELQAAAAAAAATNLTSLPPSIQHTASNRTTPVATSTKEPAEASKESHRLPAPVTRPEPQAEFAAAKQPRTSGAGEGVMNFSLFFRPAAMARASLQSAQRPPPQGTGKPSNVTVTASTRVESTVVQSSSGPRTAPVFMDQRTAWPQPKEARFTCTAAPTLAAGNLQRDMSLDRVGNMAPQKKVEATKVPEAAVATSSVCSGNGAETGNDESWREQKRKSQAECSASQDDDLEDEPGGLRRSGSRCTKRSRIAEVHNLSERRRRDRINEKMRALQELIPNCNKIDKASMLDEAIEYLKTLQLQVQMMSMGSGLCIPPMLLPPTMQHLQIPPMAHFPHLGMGLGYGMGVFDMNSTAAVPLPPMPGAHFPCSMIPGAAPQGLGIPGRNTMPMFGVPGQPIHPSASSIQPFPSLAGLPVRPNLAPQVSTTMATMAQEHQQGVANQQQQSLNNEARQAANTGDPQLQTTLQQFSIPSPAQTENSQFRDVGGNRTDTTGRNGAET